MNPIARLVFAIAKGLRDPAFRGLLLTVLLTVFFGAMFYHRLEGWSVLDSFYFCVVTLTMVGDAHLSPVTLWGKIFTMGYVLVGIGVLMGFVASLARNMGIRTPGDAQPAAPPAAPAPAKSGGGFFKRRQANKPVQDETQPPPQA